MSDNRDIVKEAQMIIDRYATRVSRVAARRCKPVKKKKKEKSLWFFAGLITSAAFFLAVFLRIY